MQVKTNQLTMNADAQNKTKEWKIETKGDFYGVVGKNNKVIIPFIYDEIIRTFSSGLVNVCKNEKWGCLDLDGNVVIPLKYDWIDPFGGDELSESKAQLNGKWGILNRNGDEIISCIYDEEIVFMNGMAFVSLNGKKGVIDKKGIDVIPCCYSYLKPFHNSSKLLKAAQSGVFGIIDISGSVIIPIIYDEIGELYNDYVVVKQHGYYGLISLRGELIIPCDYDGIDKYYHDINHLEINSQNDVFSVLKNKKWKYILAARGKCNYIQYDWISDIFFSFNYIVKLGKKYGIVNRQGEIIIPADYYRIEGYFGFFILDSGKRKGLCDTNGNELLPVSCSNIQIISGKSAIIIKDEKFYLFFFEKYKAPVEYEEISRLYSNFCKVFKDGKCGIIDDEGRIIKPLIYDDITYNYREKTVNLFKDNACETIESHQNLTKPIKKDIPLWHEEYDKVEDFYEQYGIYIVAKSNKMGIIRYHDNSTEIIVPIEYDQIRVLFSGIHLLIAEISGKYRIMKITNYLSGDNSLSFLR